MITVSVNLDITAKLALIEQLIAEIKDELAPKPVTTDDSGGSNPPGNGQPGHP